MLRYLTIFLEPRCSRCSRHVPLQLRLNTCRDYSSYRGTMWKPQELWAVSLCVLRQVSDASGDSWEWRQRKHVEERLSNRLLFSTTSLEETASTATRSVNNTATTGSTQVEWKNVNSVTVRNISKDQYVANRQCVASMCPKRVGRGVHVCVCVHM